MVAGRWSESIDERRLSRVLFLHSALRLACETILHLVWGSCCRFGLEQWWKGLGLLNSLNCTAISWSGRRTWICLRTFVFILVLILNSVLVTLDLLFCQVPLGSIFLSLDSLCLHLTHQVLQLNIYRKIENVNFVLKNRLTFDIN